MVESRLQIVVLACFSKTGESPLLSNVEAGAGASSLPPQQRELILPICCPLEGWKQDKNAKNPKSPTLG